MNGRCIVFEATPLFERFLHWFEPWELAQLCAVNATWKRTIQNNRYWFEPTVALIDLYRHSPTRQLYAPVANDKAWSWKTLFRRMFVQTVRMRHAYVYDRFGNRFGNRRWHEYCENQTGRVLLHRSDRLLVNVEPRPCLEVTVTELYGVVKSLKTGNEHAFALYKYVDDQTAWLPRAVTGDELDARYWLIDQFTMQRCTVCDAPLDPTTVVSGREPSRRLPCSKCALSTS